MVMVKLLGTPAENLGNLKLCKCTNPGRRQKMGLEVASRTTLSETEVEACKKE
jgi:hypothetical protein